ncbi:MAG: AAA family ATPase [Anaerolineaceae bacterium]
MALTKLYLENFTVFDKIDLEFSKGINVFIGENGTGKTHIMKLLYSACQAAQAKSTAIDFAQKIVRVFRPDDLALNRLVKRGVGSSNAKVKVSSDRHSITLIFNSKFKKNIEITGNESWEKQLSSLTSTFIPAKEILSNSRNLIQAIERNNVDFDDTYKDIISAASVDLTRGPDSATRKKYLKSLQEITTGTVSIKNDEFYLKPGTQSMLEFQLVAEGIRKIALLWQLIKNGTLENGSILFWDEPEANINPKHIPALVDMLFNLQKDGVQIFIATHDYFFAKYLEVRKTDENAVLFHALHKIENGVRHESDTSFTLLENNSIIAQSIALYKEEVEKVMK